MDAVLQDLRYALRQLVKSPGFTLVAVLTLGLGIGATSTLFNVVNMVFLRPRGVAAPDRLVDVYMRSSQFAHGSVSFPDYRDLREMSAAFDDVAAYRFGTLGYAASDGVRTVWSETVTGNFFDLLGVPPFLGRGFQPGRDDVEGSDLVAVVGHRFWTRELGADPEVVGRAIRLNGQPFTIIGVAPSEFTGMVRGLVADLWISTGSTQQLYPESTLLTGRSNHSFFAKARLAPGATFEQAAAEAAIISDRLADLYPTSNEGLGFSVVASEDVVLNPSLDGAITGVAVILMAIPALVLLIVCANLATLLLTRGAGRQREFAVRLALGAGRTRVVRQLLTESLVVGLLGGGIGLLVCVWASQALVAFQPPVPLPITLDLAVDARVLVFTFGMSVLAGVGFGLVPALRATDGNLAGDLHEGRVGGGVRRSRLRAALLAGQLAASVLLLVAAGLLGRGLRGAARIDLGFEPNGRALVHFDLSHARYDRDRGVRFLSDLIDRVRALPGVVTASTASRPPLDLNVSASEIAIEGRIYGEGERPPFVQNSFVGPGYFATIGARVVAGREFQHTDRALSTQGEGADVPRVVILNEAAARQLWPDGEALGRRIRASAAAGGPWLEVVGVVADVKVNTPGEGATPQVFFPVLQNYDSYQALVVQTRGDPAALLPALRQVFRDLDPDVGVVGAGLLADRVVAGLWPARFAALLLGALGLAGLAIAALGLYGTVAHSVSQRTRELGIRVALGAHVRDVMRLVVAEGMRVVGVGLLIGLVLAALVSQLLRTFLYGVSPWDPIAFLVGPVVLALVGVAACWVPARRATRVDPVEALRSE